MVSHIDTGSAADKKAAQQGRKFNGRIYGSVAQKQAAQRAAASYGQGGGPRTKATPARSLTSGWESHVIVDHFEFRLSAETFFEAHRILGTGANATAVAGLSDATDIRIQGIRIEAQIPFAATKLRWAAGCVSSLSAGNKTPTQVLAVAGAVGSHDTGAADEWFTVGLTDLKVLKKSGETEQPELILVVAAENQKVDGNTTLVRLRAHVTVLKPSAGGTSTVHVL